MTKVELEIEFSGGIFFPEIVDYMNLTVCRSGDLPPRTLTRTFQIAACLCLRRPSRLLPASMCAQEASSICVLSITTGQLRLWALQVRPAARSVPLGLRPARIVSPLRPAAGPRATP